MGLLDVLLGRSKPVKPDLDQLFGLPSAAITLEAAAGFRPTGLGSVCFAAVEGGAFAEVQQDVRALLDLDAGENDAPVESTRDAYGYTWLLLRHAPTPCRPSSTTCTRSTPPWKARASARNSCAPWPASATTGAAHWPWSTSTNAARSTLSPPAGRGRET